MKENVKGMIKARLTKLEKELANFDTYQHAHYWDFDAWLDSVHIAPRIAGVALTTSQILRQCASFEYQTMFKDWCKGLHKEDMPEYEELVAEIEELRLLLAEA